MIEVATGMIVFQHRHVSLSHEGQSRFVRIKSHESNDLVGVGGQGVGSGLTCRQWDCDVGVTKLLDLELHRLAADALSGARACTISASQAAVRVQTGATVGFTEVS
jgi:hypothetical protein